MLSALLRDSLIVKNGEDGNRSRIALKATLEVYLSLLFTNVRLFVCYNSRSSLVTKAFV